MRLYDVDDEVRLRLGGAVRGWRKSGLLSVAQERALDTDLATPLRRAGPMLRLGLALFTVIAGGAGVGLVFLLTDLSSEVAVAVTTAALGAAALGAATLIVRRFGLYRHGVEEALAVSAVGMFGFSAGLLSAEVFSTASGGGTWFSAMAAVALGAAHVHRRFGFQYAAVGALYAAALLPMSFSALGADGKRLFAALVCVGAFVYATGRRQQAADDVAGADAEVLRAAAAAGVYLALNVHLLTEPFGRSADGWFRWATWVVIWLLPFVVGRVAVVERDPLLLRAAVAAGLATLVTNKPYLGWPREPWDPMLFGVVLVGAALALRRWLAAGEAGERRGFTARQLVDSEDAALQFASVASVAAQPAAVRDIPEPDQPTFSGGRSGGAGAGGEF
ncbi:MAG: hypothetical protein R2708_07580 [Vicinamibacterales bacterium]